MKQTKDIPTINIKNNEDILSKDNSSYLDNLRHNLYMEAAANTKPIA